MNLSRPFIERPVATTLLTIGIALAGMLAYFLLPVSPLPQVDIPTIFVQATMPGASPETMSTSVATPLERHLGQIADVSEMTSQSSLGSSRIILQFGLNRDIDGAARDVQAAIVAARADLPTNLRSNPIYRKVNPSDQPILILALTSPTRTPGGMYDSAATVLAQKLSQVQGVGQVNVGGSSLPAVRVELNPHALFKYGIGLEDVRAALASANANSPKGAIELGDLHYQLYANDQARLASQYRDLIIAYRDNVAVRLSDLAEVVDGVEDYRNLGISEGKPAVLIIIQRQPNANIIDTVDRVKALLPELQAAIPSDVQLRVTLDRSPPIIASLHDVERTLLISIVLVVLVVFVFLRSAKATLIPAVAVPVSLVATFGVMYVLGFSLDTLSLMALTVATGFVVDDAVVVLENISRHVEAGMDRMSAALLGAREVGFTVLSMTLSLVAVFLPILLMGGIIGRFFREFAMTLSAAILVSLVISLTTTPMMCARLVTVVDETREGRLARWSRVSFDWLLRGYERTLKVALRNGAMVLLILAGTVCLNVYLFILVPKGLFPQQESGRLSGGIVADQSISFQSMQDKLRAFITLISADPAVASVTGSTGGGGGGGPGGGGVNTANVYVTLKTIAERNGETGDQVATRLRTKMATIAGARCYLQSSQDLRAGGRSGNAQYQYTLQSDSLDELREWAPKITTALQNEPSLTDVSSDQQDKGLESDLVIDRETAARFGLTATQIAGTLYDAFGQRQVSTIYNALNQYHVVMEVAPQYRQNPDALNDLYVSTSGGAVRGSQATNAVAGTSAPGAATPNTATSAASNAVTAATDAARNQRINQLSNVAKGSASTGAAVSPKAETMIPLSSFSKYAPGLTPLSVNHQGSFVAATVSFNLPEGASLGDATSVIEQTMNRIGVPSTVQGSFEGTAKLFQQSLGSEPLLIAVALLTIYIVLGVLYESYIHPLTILSTLPSAGIGAFLALLIFQVEFDVIALIGVFLLIGIVKKNAIMMIDFALDAERRHGLDSAEAIFQACILRFRPIMMTTLAAILGAVPLAIGFTEGSEVRRPLGIAIVGGLIVSQALTLYTTPVVYLVLDRWRQRKPKAKPLTRVGEQPA